MGKNLCFGMLFADTGSAYGFHTLPAGNAYEHSDGMGFAYRNYHNLHCNHLLFDAWRYEGCDMDGGDSGLYINRWCIGMPWRADVLHAGRAVQAIQIGWDTLDEAGRNKFSLGSFSLTDLSHSTFWVCLIYGVFINLQNYGIDQNYVQRYHTAKTEREAKNAALFGGWLYIPVSALFFLIGTCLFSYYKVFPDAQVAAFEAAGKTDYVFPYFMVHSLPTGLTGLLIASVFAAGMSTVATSVTSCSTILLTDYWMRMRKHVHRKGHDHSRGIGDKEHLMVLKLGSVLIGILGICVALALVNVDSILDAWWKLSSIFSGGMLGLFLLGYLSTKVKNIHAVIGVLCGFAVIAWISAWNWIGLPNPGLHEYLAIVLGTMTIFIVGFALVLFIPVKNK